ncbi:MAG: cytochrome c, partial [Aquificae bacterium]|nr:cytochrome c [Aquificota bacterium]
MKKLALGLVALSLTITACQKGQTATQELPEEEINRGYQVYKTTCAKCHWETVTPEKMKQIREYRMKYGKPPFGGPPMSEISARVKK